VEAASYVEFLPADDDNDDAMDEGKAGEAKALEVTLQCNAALAFLKAQQWAEAAQHASAALKKDGVRACVRLCICM
jgi:hypothetical protein